MIEFQKLEGPYGIPVYFQSTFSPLQSVSLEWSMFVGGADDEKVGTFGTYHWFEHVPFRGTKHFPGGYKGTKGWLSEYHGSAGGVTNRHRTNYWVYVPKEIWQKGLELITDLMSQPLLEEKSIQAERKIIKEEIVTYKASAQQRIVYELYSILWPGHPLGHHVLGTEKSLDSMTPETLKHAHEAGYDRSRCVLFAAGNISANELLNQVWKIADRIPERDLEKRRGPASHGALPPWQSGVKTEIETDFSSSTALMLFPAMISNDRHLLQWEFLTHLFKMGSSSSPLYKILREERSLVYSTNIYNSLNPDGGFWGLRADARRENIPEIIKAFAETLKSEAVRSRERFQEIKKGVKFENEMAAISSKIFTNTAENQLTGLGRVFSSEEKMKMIDSYSHDEVISWLEKLSLDQAHTIIFNGIKTQ